MLKMLVGGSLSIEYHLIVASLRVRELMYWLFCPDLGQTISLGRQNRLFYIFYDALNMMELWLVRFFLHPHPETTLATLPPLFVTDSGLPGHSQTKRSTALERQPGHVACVASVSTPRC